MTEDQWWNDLQDDEIEDNAYGVPHYDVLPVADFIEKHIDFSHVVLDLGCGPGRLGHELARRHPHSWVYGIDVSPQMIYLSRTAPTNWMAAVNDGTTIPLCLYSGAYAVTVFQHIPWKAAYGYTEQVYRQLRPGGRFIFTYAVGDGDTFLSHQASHELALDWLGAAGFGTREILTTPADHPPWYWAVGQK